jgi:spore maturation protein CgeB
MISLMENLASRQAPEKSKQGSKPRICMPTFRNVAKMPFHCGRHEAQDVLAEVEDVDMISLEPGSGFRFKERWQRRLLFRDVSRRLIFQNPGLRKVRLTREYDLFMVVCATYWDLPYVNAIEGWRDQCKTSVCWLDEMWVSEIPYYKYWLHVLNQFDYVFVGFRGTVDPLSKAIGRSCHWVPGAVDTLRFSPFPKSPERVIDVYSVGRRGEDMHQALLQAAARQEIFYVYDTFQGVGLEVSDARQHREFLANMAKRSRFFVVAPTKTTYTQGQVEIAYRYYEGAAAGAVMIGQSPNIEAFGKIFPWPDAVIHTQPDGSDTMDVIASLSSEPERMAMISRRNTAEALLRHDWVHRWKQIFQLADIQPSPGMAARESRLKELADLAINGA